MNIWCFIFMCMFCLDDYLSVQHLIVRWLNLLDRKALMQTCLKFSYMSSLTLAPMPVSQLKVVSEYESSIINLQYHFQQCLHTLPPVLPSITTNLPVMYENMSLSAAFKHLVICVINGCRMCRTTEQWSTVLPRSVYQNYLYVSKQQQSANIVTPHVLINFMKKYSDFRSICIRNNMVTFMRKYYVNKGYEYIDEQIIVSDCICRFKNGIEYQSHDLIDRYCYIDTMMAGLFAIQMRVFLNMFVIPHYLSLYLEHMYVVKHLGNACQKTESMGGFKSCVCFMSNMVPSTLFMWGMRTFFHIHQSVDMLHPVEWEMKQYYKNNKALMASNIPHVVCRPQSDVDPTGRPLENVRKHFLFQNASGIIRECPSNTESGAHVIIDEEVERFDLETDEENQDTSDGNSEFTDSEDDQRESDLDFEEQFDLEFEHIVDETSDEASDNDL